jgi:RNA polymerase sigma-70 factor (ECF subfamily)
MGIPRTMRSDEALCEQLLGGDLRAFDQLYERYERPLFGFIRKHLADIGEAEDVLHETFLALLRERAAARSHHSLKAWLYQVARHLCLNRQRSRKRSARAIAALAQAPREHPSQPEQALLQHEAAQALRRSVARLPTKLAELYALRAGGLSYGEMATVLGVPVGTVKSRMHEMIGRLREEMDA